MLWLVLILLLAALGVLWWRFAMPARAGSTLVPPALNGNHASLRTRHYRLADFQDAPLKASPSAASAAGEEEVQVGPTDSQPETASPAEADDQQGGAKASESTEEAGQLPEGAKHNYITAPAPTATDEHNRGVELTAAERRARMRSVMSEALDNRRAAPATA
ncbi:hypothetical protein [Hymenobacter elongatus]|uniref:Uncharacterized protein n=1 Tax=Hymenobacter elongatus TaxID=877208 RepID=A0A4Z0PLP3_9BACT|nr:hypothetical protein [Hymenobacter elongatus]TGE14984.1 hypothetical protein E5J99_13835 [Hymenobacter elongatus]